jgi:hypothetical protein
MSSRNSKASEKGCYCNRFTCLCFRVLHFALRPSIYFYSKLVFPMGGFFQGYVDQKHICQFHACLEV